MASYEVFGWHRDDAAVEEALKSLPIPQICKSDINGTGKGKVALLYQPICKLIGKYPLRSQTTSDCVSMSTAGMVDNLTGIQHYMLGTNEEWQGECASEIIYAGSRVEIAKSVLGRSGGSNNVWAARWVSQFGVLPRKKYGSIDLTVYSGKRADAWGMPNVGVPDELEPIAKQHPVKTYSQVRTWEECLSALSNYYPVTIASNQGFSNVRSKDGFASPQSVWPHSMLLIGCKDDNRPGALCVNSWNVWNSGPKGEYDIPDGSFWIDAEVLERNILSQNDSWAFSSYEGFKPQELDLSCF